MMDLLSAPDVWASLITLVVMEIVLGIDNIVFISVLVSRLPADMAERARKIGILLALVFRIVLLFALTWLIGLTKPLFSILEHSVSMRDAVLLAGGLFLMAKATMEIHSEIEGEPGENDKVGAATFYSVIVQVILIDMVFSVDSIITAIGMAEHIEVMVAAVVISVIVMYLASGAISNFIKEHPTTKMLALAFLLLIGVALIADGIGFHIPRGYIYFSMTFAGLVEMFNIIARRRRSARRT